MHSELIMLLVATLTTFSSLISLTSASDALRDEREVAARKWSPLVWLHPAENFFPSSVPFFLQHITLSREITEEERQAVVQQGLATPHTILPSGWPSRDVFLLVSHNFSCLDCPLPGFLHGQKPDKKYSPPVYVTIHTCSAQPSARVIKSTHHSLFYDLFSNENYTDVSGNITTTPSPQNEYRSTFAMKNSSVPFIRNLPYSSDSHSLSSTFQFNQTQTRNTHSFISVLGVTKAVNNSFNENDTITSPLICLNNGSQCFTKNIDENKNSSLKNFKVILDAQSSSTKSMGMTDLSSTTDIPYTNMTLPTIDYSTEFENSSWIRSREYTAPIDGTNDFEKDTTTGQYHYNERRHAQPSTPYEQQYTVTYWMFYPYNKGKKVCTLNLGYFLGRMLKPRVNGACHGEEIVLGDHVGDWEHVSIQFSGSKPSRMYVSSHTFGAYYIYDPQNNRFVYEDQDTREGITMSPIYPKIIQLAGSHPVLYSARGSHGLWGAEGINRYNLLPALQDETRKGNPWKTWMNLKLIDMQDPLAAQPHRLWWKYEGRWGNPSSKCHLMLAGVCELSKGPTGIPRKRRNFPCRDV